jgi:hypothetical protein
LGDDWILIPQETNDDGWHPLSGQPAPELIPATWLGWHTGKRLAEAMRTLGFLSINGHPLGYTSAWPRYMTEWGDVLARLEGDEEQQRQDAAAKNWTKIVPTSIEIGRMETAIVWPGRYLGEFPQLLRAVGAVAQARARYLDIAHAARKLNLPGRHVRRWNDEGLDRIAAGLRLDEVAMF